MSSSTWTDEDLRRISGTTAIQVASRRPDRTLCPYVTVRAVRSAAEVYIRSAYGPENGWFRRAAAVGIGRIRAGGIERDVSFERLAANSPVQDDIDASYHAKYDRYGPQMVGAVIGPAAAAATLKVLPGIDSR
jgi:hypothetical protein